MHYYFFGIEILLLLLIQGGDLQVSCFYIDYDMNAFAISSAQVGWLVSQRNVLTLNEL